MNNQIDMTIAVDADNAIREMDRVEKKAQKFNELQSRMRIENNKFAKKFTDNMNDMSVQTVKFNGNMLSLMFFGMQLQKTMTGALTSIFEGYKKIIPESAEFNKLTTQLSANWEFFKFQMASALANSPLFTTFIQFIITAIKWLQALPEPVKTFLGFLMIITAGLGAIAFTVGVWALGMGSIINIASTISIGISGIVTATKAWAIANGSVTASVLTMYAAWLLPITAILGIMYLWKKLVDKFGLDVGLMAKSWKDYVIIFVGAFLNGVVQIIGSIVQLGTFFIDFFINVGKAAVKFGQGLADVIAAALDPTRTVKDAFSKMFDDIKKQFMDPKNYSLTAGVQNIKDKLSAETLKITQDLVNTPAANNSTPSTTNNIIVMNNPNDLVSQGYLNGNTFNNLQANGLFLANGR